MNAVINPTFTIPSRKIEISTLAGFMLERGVNRPGLKPESFFVPGLCKRVTVEFSTEVAKPTHKEGMHDALMLPAFWLEHPEVIKHTLAMFFWAVNKGVKLCDLMLTPQGPCLMRAAADHTGTTEWVKKALKEGAENGSESAKRFLAAFE